MKECVLDFIKDIIWEWDGQSLGDFQKSKLYDFCKSLDLKLKIDDLYK